jgi:single-strand DNA-binding protein
MNETTMTLVGNLVDDPELRFTPAGQPVAKFRVASTPRYRDGKTGEWKDGEALFLTCVAWRQLAENAAESLTRGMRVIVTGRLQQRSYETKEGDKRSVYELQVDEVGPSLRSATAKVAKVSRTSDSNGGQRQAEPDPWAAAPATGGLLRGTSVLAKSRSARLVFPSVRGRTSVSVIRSSQCQCTGQVGIRYPREVCSLAPESALWPSRKVSGPGVPRFATSPLPNTCAIVYSLAIERAAQIGQLWTPDAARHGRDQP